LQGAELTEMGELAEAGMRRVLAGRGTAHLIPACCCGRCSTRRPSAIACGCAPRIRISPRAASRTTAKSRPASVLAAIPPAAETIALATIFALVRSTGVQVHLCRLSSADGVAMVRAAKAGGLCVTCDVGAHHLHLCDVDIGWFDAQCRLIPPLRGIRDRAALRAGLADGTIDLVCSDHAPVDDDGKQLPFGEAEPGATGLELLLPLVLKWAAEDKVPARRRGLRESRRGPRRSWARRRASRRRRACRCFACSTRARTGSWSPRRS
jgi:dihydroorotase